jgi:hypothetical protein
MVAKGYHSDAMMRLEYYQQKLTGAPDRAPAAVVQSVPPDAAARILAKLEEIQEQMETLTKRVDALAEKDSQPAGKPARQPYPSV